MTRPGAAGATIVAVLGLAACTSPAPPQAQPGPSPTDTPPPSASPTLGLDAVDEDLRAALMSIPDTASILTFTDFAAVEERLGYADLTSESIATDRIDFWEQVRSEAALFTEGRLLSVSSTMETDYGWTQEDVDWEANFTTPEGDGGFVLGLRDGVDMGDVTRSFAANGFRGGGRVWQAAGGSERTGAARVPFDAVLVDHGRRLVVSGRPEAVRDVRDAQTLLSAAGQAEPLQTAAGVVDHHESLLLRTGEDACVRLDAALGADVDPKAHDAYLADHDVAALRQPAVSGLGVTGSEEGEALVGFADAAAVDHDRAHRVGWTRRWRTRQTDQPFTDVAEVGGASLTGAVLGVDLLVRQPGVLVAMALDDEMPWALCNDVRTPPEPTGP